MKYLTRYIASTVITHVLLVTLILIGVQSFLGLVAEMGSLGQSHYNIAYALLVVTCHMPGYTYQLFPVAGLIGSMIGLGRLASTGELVVMQAAGFSQVQVARAVLVSAFIMMVVVTLCGEWLAPKLNWQADKIKNQALGKVLTADASHLWQRQGKRYIFLQHMLSANTAQHGLTFSYNSQGDLDYMMSAAEVKKVNNGKWEWDNARKTTFKNGQPILHKFAPKQFILMSANSRLADINRQNNSYLTLPGLYSQIKAAQNIGLTTVTMRFDFWHRVLQPITTLIMICLGVPFVFGAMREVGAGWRVVIGISVGFVFYVLNQVLGPLCLVLQIHPLIAALTPSILFFVIYLWGRSRSLSGS